MSCFYPSRLIVALFAALSLPFAYAEKWREITPEEFALSEPVVDPEYGAEILFSESKLEQRIRDGDTVGSFQYYERIKVYSEKGIDQLAKAQLTYGKGEKISGIQGRTVKPDGTVIKLEKSNIFDQEVIKKGSAKLRAKRFAFPGLEPGDIVELQYSQRTGDSAWFIQLPMLRSLPAQRVRRRIKPFEYDGIGFRIASFQYPGAKLERNSSGFYDFELTNLPAKSDEPYSLPNIHSGPFVLLYYYDSAEEPSIKNYWSGMAKNLAKEGKKKLKPSKDIIKFVREYTKEAKTDTERLKKLYLYCQDEITNLHYAHGHYTTREIEDLPENRSPQQTFKRGYGYPSDIDRLFGAMVKALGLDARLAKAPDNRFMRFSPSMKIMFSLSEECIAVKVDGEFQFYHPGNPFLSADSIEWWCYGNQIMVGEEKGEPFRDIPMPPAEKSVRRRTGKFSIDEFGTLKGRVTEMYSGFKDLDMKEELSHRLSVEEREEYIVQELKAAQSRAEATGFKIKNRGSSTQPMTVEYDLEIPEYADVTGKRIFVQACVFGKGVDPMFSKESRQGDIQFPYPWGEVDDFAIAIPEGYELEEGSAPAPLTLGIIGNYEIKMGISRKTGEIIYKRNMEIHLPKAPVKVYDLLKKAFDLVHHRDQHTLTFKKMDTSLSQAIGVSDDSRAAGGS